jgi:2-isopropylmalate synthase
MPRTIAVFDTTLRDGEQSPGASLEVGQKLDIARQLARLKVDVMEAGFPIASQGDFEAVKLIAQHVKGPVICGLARALPDDIKRCWEAVKHAQKPRIHTFIATSDIHMERKLRMTRQQVLDMTAQAVKLAKGFVEDVEFSPEDATRSDRDFLCRAIQVALEAGATVINIPDTVGYTMPAEFGSLIAHILKKVPGIEKATLSVHCHNDLGMAVANSLAAVVNGADQVECTVNGIGERAGNASLEEIVMALDTRRDFYGAATRVDKKEIYRTSRMVSDMTGIVVQPNKAVVGSNAFAHEAGIHQHGVIQDKRTYEIMDAKAVGISESKLVLGKHSGKHAFQQNVKALGYDLEREQLQRAFERFKDLADKKKDITERDIESIAADELHRVPELYRLDYMHVMSGSGTVPSATVRLLRNDEPLQGAGFGVGTVDAVYKTIDKLAKIPHRLVDFTVKAVTGGTEALGEVTVRIADRRGNIYIGRGSHEDVVLASARAYVQAINKLAYARESKRVHPQRTGESS